MAVVRDTAAHTTTRPGSTANVHPRIRRHRNLAVRDGSRCHRHCSYRLVDASATCASIISDSVSHRHSGAHRRCLPTLVKDTMVIHPLVVRIGRTQGATALLQLVLARIDRTCYRLTSGRWVPSRWLLHTVMLTTTGHRTGQPRLTPLCAHRRADGSWLVAGTNFGRPRHPAWSTNLLRCPRATITVNGHTLPVDATLLTPEQRTEQRSHILRIHPLYDNYASRVTREIRVFHLLPTDHAHEAD